MKIEKTVKKGKEIKTITLIDEVPQGQKGRKVMVLTEDGAEYVSKLASLGCTTQEIADDFGIDLKTLLNPRNRARFQDAVRNGKSTFKTSIRTSQMKIMKGGSAPMAIFLGKNYLDQADTKENVQPDGVISPIEVFAKALAKYKDDEDDDRDSSSPE